MRITGGAARGIILRLPAKGEIRPATDYLREAVFSSLGESIKGARVLDVFAGTGAYGLEAASRGAGRALWVEKNGAAIKALQANRMAVAKSMGIAGEDAQLGEIRQADAFVWEPFLQQRFDFIFADPPYVLFERQGDQLIKRLMSWLAPEGVLVLEAPGSFQPALPAQYICRRRLAKGPHQPSALFLEFGQ